jgi:AraC-like DNA-binding protein
MVGPRRGVFDGELPMMSSGDHFKGYSTLEYASWVHEFNSICGRHSPECVDPKTFVGSARADSICGFAAADISCNLYRCLRTQRDARHDGRDDYLVAFQLAGQSTLVQNDTIANLTVADVVLVDLTRSATWVCEERNGRWFNLLLSRQSLISHFGMEPKGGMYRPNETPAARLLFHLIRDAANDCDLAAAAAEPYMQLAIYDLLGALFGAADLPAISSHSDKLFRRICDVIKDHLADPDFSLCDVAAEAGISLRYVQKLFAVRGSTFGHFICSHRLDQAARLLQRRTMLKTGQPLSEIAYACGFRDYRHFARSFRRRFGCPPSGRMRD